MRQKGMSRNQKVIWTWLAVIVCAHLIVSLVHGMAHAGAHVPLSAAANAFVLVVILAGPLIGLALTWRSERLGGWVVAVTMAGSLVFGVVNHFVVTSPDHVGQVDTQWRGLFATTALLLVLTEALGSVLAIAFLRERQRYV
jgi:hypothetical protein